MTRTAQSRRAFPFAEFKALDEAAGTFEGYLAVFDNTDLGGDVIEPGAFTKTLGDARERKARGDSAFLWPILWQHDEHEPIGGFTEAREDAHGLYVRGQLDLNADLGRRAYSGMKMGYLRGLSIGYDTVRHKWVGDSRHLQEVRLWEGSAVTFPMNQDAGVTSVKAADQAAKDAQAARAKRYGIAVKDGGNVSKPGQWKDVPDAEWGDPVNYRYPMPDKAHADNAAARFGAATARAPYSTAEQAIIDKRIAAAQKKFGESDQPDDGGKAASMSRRTRRKARDFASTLTTIQESDTLQEDWHDTFQAFVSAMCAAMWDARYPPITLEGADAAPDPMDLAQTNIDQFAAAMTDLAKRSVAAGFAPMLDDDGDSFQDPDEDDDDCYARMSADLAAEMKAEREQRYPARRAKSGRVMSAANHAALTKAAGMIHDGHKAISDFLKANDPKNGGATPPQQTDASGDTGQSDQPAGDGKSAGRSLVRAGAFAARFPATTAALQVAAGATGAGAAKGTATRTAQPTQPSGDPDDDEIARFRARLAEMRRGGATATAQ